jgi:maltose/maltodextrin transport system permease protein
MKYPKLLPYLFVAALNAIIIWAIFTLFSFGNYGFGIIFTIFLIFLDWSVFSSKGYPYRYTLPAMFFLFILTLYPIYFTVSTAFTNYGTGHLFSRENVMDTLMNDSRYYYEPENMDLYDFKVFVRYDNEFRPTEDFLLMLYNEDNLLISEKPETFFYDNQGSVMQSESNLYKVENDTVRTSKNTYNLLRPLGADIEEDKSLVLNIESEDGKIYTYFYSPFDRDLAANSAFYNSVLRQNYINSLLLHYEQKNFRLSSGTVYRKFGESYNIYDAKVVSKVEGDRTTYKTILVNKLTNTPLVEKESAFWDYNSRGNLERLAGYTDFVGWKNFLKVFQDPRVSGPFLKIFVWTFLYALFSVLATFALGLFFAMLLNDSNLKGRVVYRTLLIIPWAIPIFISVLVWRNGFLNETYGIVNRFFLANIGIEPIKWLTDPLWAKISIILVNTWLGFPYMMTISLGALQSIPDELYEASSIDGASNFRKFRSITFPLLMVSMAPLLVMSFAFNFNNFVNIYLLTGGGPPIPGAVTQAGSTDILISYTYKLAFEGSAGQDFGFAASISVLIFFIVATISYFNFKFTGAFEEVSR